MALGASLVPFFLVNNLLLLNQFPDVAADRQAGRRHLLVQHGPQGRPAATFAAMGGAAYASLVLGVVATGVLPAGALLGLLGVATCGTRHANHTAPATTM